MATSRDSTMLLVPRGRLLARLDMGWCSRISGDGVGRHGSCRYGDEVSNETTQGE